MKSDFICGSCGFHFSADKKKDRCPYCGEKKIRQTESAEKLIENL